MKLGAVPGSPHAASMPAAFGPGTWGFAGTKESLRVSTGPRPSCPQPSSFWCPVGVLGLWPLTPVLFLLASCGPQQGSPRGPRGGCETCCPLVAGLFPCCSGASQAEATWAVPSAGLRGRGSLPVPDKGYSVQGWVLSLLAPALAGSSQLWASSACLWVRVFQGPTAQLTEVLLLG